MSYSSLKRMVGETHLERKCRLLFGFCLLILIAGSFWWYGNTTKELVYEQNQLRGDLLANTILLQKHWEKLETNAQFKEAVVEKLSAHLQSEQYEGTFIRPDGTATDGEPTDDWEKSVVELFKKLPPPPSVETQPTVRETGNDPVVQRWEQRYTSGGNEYLFYKPIYALSRGQCVECHRALTGPDDLAEGDLMAVARVRMQNAATETKLSKNRAVMITAAIVTVFLAMVVAYVIVRYIIVKPLKHLRNVSDAVSRGDIHQRADIHTGDEFEELAVAFNRMLRNLVAIQEELRQVNGSLDQKVDQLAQANMQLFEMNRLKSDFLATMSHELRTPLNSIIGFSDVLGSIVSLDDKQRRYVKNIQASGRVLLDMINDILDLAKIESGKMAVRLTDFDIAQVVDAQCDMARPLTERKNIDLETDIEPGLPPLHQDQSKVQQILNNLLSNAIKFTPEGGRIRIAVRRDRDGFFNLIVSDTGVGIAEEDRTQIFEKFRQGASALAGGDAMTREYSGTGLGLSIVKELCKLLGGEVLLESEVGKGSTFTIRLPWRLDRPRHLPAQAEGDHAGLKDSQIVEYETLLPDAATGAK